MEYINLMNLSVEQLDNLTQEQIASGVREHINWLQSAVYDAAGYDEDLNFRGYGVERDCAADDAYDDPDLLQSLIGDHVPMQKGSWGTFLMLYEFREQGHKAIKIAVDRMANYYC